MNAQIFGRRSCLLALVLALFALVGCDPSPADRQTNAVTDAQKASELGVRIDQLNDALVLSTANLKAIQVKIDHATTPAQKSAAEEALAEERATNAALRKQSEDDKVIAAGLKTKHDEEIKASERQAQQDDDRRNRLYLFLLSVACVAVGAFLFYLGGFADLIASNIHRTALCFGFLAAVFAACIPMVGREWVLAVVLGGGALVVVIAAAVARYIAKHTGDLTHTVQGVAQAVKAEAVDLEGLVSGKAHAVLTWAGNLFAHHEHPNLPAPPPAAPPAAPVVLVPVPTSKLPS